MLTGLVSLTILILSFSSLMMSQDGATAAKVDEVVRYEMEKRQTPGVAVAVVKDGRVVMAKGYGLANVELQVPVKTETVFQIASVTKQFTAAAIMMLVESGKLTLDDKVGKYITNAPASWSGITIRHLLTHTSGLTDYPDGFDYRRDYTEDELIKAIESVPLAFQPGEKWEYSNAGYVTLGVIIRKVTGKFWGDFLQENIFKPLGMTTARVISEASIIPNRSSGYIIYDGRLINQQWVSPTLNRTADGSLYMSVLDLAKWDAALYGETILKRASLDQMWTPVKLNNGTTAPYGFGWSVMEANGYRLLEHEGAWQGFNANIARYVNDKLTVIVLANLKTARAPMISHAVAGVFMPAVAPPRYVAIDDKEPKVTAMVKDLMKAFAAGKPDETLFTAEERAALFPGTTKIYESYLKPIGEPVKVQLVERSDTPAGRLYRWEFYYKSVILLVSITLDKDGKITGITAVDNY